MSNSLQIILCILFALSTICTVTRIILKIKDRKNGNSRT